MRIEASAPGKLVVLGEYAVLEGAPALVQAIDRRARVTLTTHPHDTWEIISPTLGLDARLRLGPERSVWQADAPPELAWVATLLEAIPDAAQLPPCRMELDSDRFYTDHAGERVKLGLGSSAALSVSLLGALHALGGQPAPSLVECVRAHRTTQYGRGSGIDIAAALHGGLSRYQLVGGTPQHAVVRLPAGLRWRCVFSGQPASTSALLATVAAWRARQPAAHARVLAHLAKMTARGIHAVSDDDAAAFLSSLNEYAAGLARLGAASGADIVSRAHRELAAIAASCGAVYKSSGAGGGDVGITFGVDDRQLEAFEIRASDAGYAVIGLGAESQGLEVVISR